MDEAAKAARAAYMRKWRAENRERLKQYQQRYWEKKAAQQAVKEKTDKPIES